MLALTSSASCKSVSEGGRSFSTPWSTSHLSIFANCPTTCVCTPSKYGLKLLRGCVGATLDVLDRDLQWRQTQLCLPQSRRDCLSDPAQRQQEVKGIFKRGRRQSRNLTTAPNPRASCKHSPRSNQVPGCVVIRDALLPGTKVMHQRLQHNWDTAHITMIFEGINAQVLHMAIWLTLTSGRFSDGEFASNSAQETAGTIGSSQVALFHSQPGNRKTSRVQVLLSPWSEDSRDLDSVSSPSGSEGSATRQTNNNNNNKCPIRAQCIAISHPEHVHTWCIRRPRQLALPLIVHEGPPKRRIFVHECFQPLRRAPLRQLSFAGQVHAGELICMCPVGSRSNPECLKAGLLTFEFKQASELRCPSLVRILPFTKRSGDRHRQLRGYRNRTEDELSL